MPDPKLAAKPAPVEVIEASTDPQSPKLNPFDLELGPPFALAQGCDLLARDDAQGLPGSYAAVRCNCGALWRADLLSDDDKQCPSCQVAYTHVLLFCPTTERHMLAAVVEEVLQAHGLIPDDDDDQTDDDDDDDDHAASTEFLEDDGNDDDAINE
jgi:hypothetical protein